MLTSHNIFQNLTRCIFTEEPKYWHEKAGVDLDKRILAAPIKNKAKHLIMFLGDGMSIPTVTAGRILKGQLHGGPGEDSVLAFEAFPHVSLSKTYALDKQVADSACTATAYLCGSKANYGTIGVDGRVKKGDCKASQDPTTHVTSILAWAQKKGMSTGIITTARVTHASPSGTYAHTAHRDWEAHTYDNPGCVDIATQLIKSEPGKNINVILGGGRVVFLPKALNGSRIDGKNLIEEWKADKKDEGIYVDTKDDLEKVTDKKYLLGLFNMDHLTYMTDREKGTSEPTLTEMTTKAIELLKKNPNGFFLFVEGGRIDHGHHDSEAKHALYELVEMDNAIEKATKMTETDDTLIVVTADHAHTMSINGYPPRGNDIFGFAGVGEKDHLLYTTLSYANGPGKTNRTVNLTLETVSKYQGNYFSCFCKSKSIFCLCVTASNNYRQDSIVYLKDETHGGDDVGVFAQGPFAHLYTGVHEQSYIPHLMAYAACISEKQGPHCTNSQSSAYKNSSAIISILMAALAFLGIR
ncbi:hypothetical protein LAZ67_21000480 [Cordylochernes scorpioides]|uniref:Alkaline phosphatase n=1 Tax=Cordylochernes scorpioides TaxID=51811 RepID=A0ABY6LLI3_9ARAC|nr:hypothetical protein LAZ67_21000480 [Cordylochernes scorpioides]